MNLDRYEYEVGVNYLDYEFNSEGPKGVIRKIICFTLVNVSGFFYYNLAFGNLNEGGETFDDFVLSNNEDAEKILATVASAILDFTNHYPYAIIYAEGRTASRNRWYQMEINKYWKEINQIFEIYGLVKEKGFEPFQHGKNYSAFVARRKKA